LTPQITPAGGTFLTAQTVSISVSPSTAKIFYTTDGSTPNQTSTPYAGPIKVGASEILQAVGVLPGVAPSPIATAAYVLPFLYPIVGFEGITQKGYAGDGGPAIQASLYEADDVAFDRVGDMYVADSLAHVIRKISAQTGIISTVAGDGYNAGNFDIGGYSGDGGPATSARLNTPTSIAFDSHNNMYIADSENYIIRKVDATTKIITTFAGTVPAPYAQGGYLGDGGPATKAHLLQPEFVAVDSHDNLFIADTENDVVRKVSADTGIITTVAGTGPTSDSKGAYTGDGGPATKAQLIAPPEIALDKDDNLYIAGLTGVRKVSSATGIITTVAGGIDNTPGPYGGPGGDGGPATKAYLQAVTSVSIDASGDLYLTGPLIDTVREVDATTGMISKVAGALQYGYSGYYGPALYADLEAPYSTVFDSVGNLYLAQFDTVAKISLTAVADAPY
jgi:hypothetical protein